VDIQLNFINRSNDVNNSQVLIFSKNVATGVDEPAIAWQVIKNCGRGWNHPFTYPLAIAVGASDAYGNHAPQMAAEYGQGFQVVREASGDALTVGEPASSPTEVQLMNNLPQGAINAAIYKSGSLYAIKTGLAPGQKAVFSFKPTIWIGVASQVEQGQVVNAAIMSAVNTEISLLGIASADIVLTGGGAGPDAQPFQFSLQNVGMA
jgi:hypothetical protein